MEIPLFHLRPQSVALFTIEATSKRNAEPRLKGIMDDDYLLQEVHEAEIWLPEEVEAIRLQEENQRNRSRQMAMIADAQNMNLQAQQYSLGQRQEPNMSLQACNDFLSRFTSEGTSRTFLFPYRP